MCDSLGDFIEITRSDKPLMGRGAIAVMLGRELPLLEVGVRGHPGSDVASGQLEHRMIEGVKSRQGDELESISHRRQLSIELTDRGRIKFLLPVERRRAVVGQKFL